MANLADQPRYVLLAINFPNPNNPSTISVVFGDPRDSASPFVIDTITREIDLRAIETEYQDLVELVEDIIEKGGTAKRNPPATFTSSR